MSLKLREPHITPSGVEAKDLIFAHSKEQQISVDDFSNHFAKFSLTQDSEESALNDQQTHPFEFQKSQQEPRCLLDIKFTPRQIHNFRSRPQFERPFTQKLCQFQSFNQYTKNTSRRSSNFNRSNHDYHTLKIRHF